MLDAQDTANKIKQVFKHLKIIKGIILESNFKTICNYLKGNAWNVEKHKLRLHTAKILPHNSQIPRYIK